MKCEHELVKMKDGSLDMICLKCGNKFKQGQLTIKLSVIVNVDVTQAVRIINEEIETELVERLHEALVLNINKL